MIVTGRSIKFGGTQPVFDQNPWSKVAKCFFRAMVPKLSLDSIQQTGGTNGLGWFFQGTQELRGLPSDTQIDIQNLELNLAANICQNAGCFASSLAFVGIVCSATIGLPLGDLPSSVHYGVNSLRLDAAGPAACRVQAPDSADRWSKQADAPFVGRRGWECIIHDQSVMFPGLFNDV